MTACPSSVVLGFMMISRSIPSFSMTRFKAGIAYKGMLVVRNPGSHTFEINPQVVGIENFEFAD